MKKNELKNKTVEERKKISLELQKELMILRAQVSMGTAPKNPGRIKAIKRELARIKTFENIREAGRKNE